MYKIVINYSTGNSYGSQDETQEIELKWDDINVAKDNLQRIKEHYEQYTEINGFAFSTKRTNLEILMSNITKLWFVNSNKLFCVSSNRPISESDKEKVGEGNWGYRPDDYLATKCLYLILDDGNILQYSAFWCGYFESLSKASIELDRTDMEINF